MSGRIGRIVTREAARGVARGLTSVPMESELYGRLPVGIRPIDAALAKVELWRGDDLSV